jgi:hypothetical protein
MKHRSKLDGRGKTEVGSCIVHATWNGRREISMSRGSESVRLELGRHAEPHSSARARSRSVKLC